MILHLCVLDKFIDPFFQFTKENMPDFDVNHQFYINVLSNNYSTPKGENVFLAGNAKPLARYAWLAQQINKADKIILHGLWDHRINQLLSFQPWALKKCYWAIWGGDLYTYQLSKRTLGWWRNEAFRRFIIKRIGHFITHIRGDYELAQKWYGAKGIWHECFMYPSNLYQDSLVRATPHDGINILLGNSADPSNNHIDALEKLRPYATEDIQIFCPLSYGDAENAKKVVDYGKSIFGDRFIPLLEFMRFDEYKTLLAQIDIAIFNHKRQQGMGNITTLLGMGKKVFIRSNVTSYHAIRSLGALVYDVEHIDLSPIDINHASRNSKIIANYFSSEHLTQSWRQIYEG